MLHPNVLLLHPNILMLHPNVPLRQEHMVLSPLHQLKPAADVIVPFCYSSNRQSIVAKQKIRKLSFPDFARVLW
jgi:hypothetical protein